MLLEEFVRQTLDNIGSLRDRLRREASVILPALPDLSSRFTGDAYVESVGTIVHFERGSADFFYTPTATEMVDRAYGRQGTGRHGFFDAMAVQLPAGSRVLNIGAGADTTPIERLLAHRHEVVCTDMAEDTVRALRAKIDVPAFACDLLYLDRVLPDRVDFVCGNSVLGYLDPLKLGRVIQNIERAAKRGCVFTFDLAPHPHYFRMVAEGEGRTLVNASDPDPARLLFYIGKYGRTDGVNAMAYHAHYRALAVNLAVISLLKARFEGAGLRCTTGAGTGDVTNLTLRISRDYDAILSPTSGEVMYSDPSEYFEEHARQNHPWYIMQAVDRISGELLAKALGIHRDKRSDPWLVAEYVAKNQDSAKLADVVRQAVLADISPGSFLSKIQPYVAGEQTVSSSSLPPPVAADQIMHKMVITGAAPFGREEADAKIDALYAGYGGGAKSIEVYRADIQGLAGMRRTDAQTQDRVDRNKAKANRKKQRKR